MKLTRPQLIQIVEKELEELLGEPKSVRQPMQPPPGPIEVFDSVRELWPGRESTEAEKVGALEDIWRLLDKALIGTGKQSGLLQLGEAWWKEEIPKPTLPDFATPERVHKTADRYEELFGHRPGAPVELARSNAKLYELVAQELEKRMAGEEAGRITKGDLVEAIVAILNEHAKDYVWGVLGPRRVANQAGLRPLKASCDE